MIRFYVIQLKNVKFRSERLKEFYQVSQVMQHYAMHYENIFLNSSKSQIQVGNIFICFDFLNSHFSHQQQINFLSIDKLSKSKPIKSYKSVYFEIF